VTECVTREDLKSTKYWGKRVRQFSIVSFIYLSVAMQSSALAAELPVSCLPFLPALTLIGIAYWSTGIEAILWSACLGFMLDGISAEPFGLQMALAAGISGGLQCVRENSRKYGFITMVAQVFLVTLVWRASSSLVSDNRSMPGAVMTATIVSAFQDAVVTAGLAAIIFTGDRFLLSGLHTQRDTRYGLDKHRKTFAR